MSEVWWKELRERDPEQWERLTERKNARNNCALMAVFIERNNAIITNVEEHPDGDGCIVQFLRKDMKGRVSDITISDDTPEKLSAGAFSSKSFSP